MTFKRYTPSHFSGKQTAPSLQAIFTPRQQTSLDRSQYQLVLAREGNRQLIAKSTFAGKADEVVQVESPDGEGCDDGHALTGVGVKLGRILNMENSVINMFFKADEAVRLAIGRSKRTISLS